MSTRSFGSSFAVLLLSVLACGSALAQTSVVERMGVPGPVTFSGAQYALAWSSNPSPDLYKQEYVPAGQTVEHFEDMLMIDWRPNSGDANQMVKGMAELLEARKSTDPLANYAVLKQEDGKGGIVDFVMSATDAGGNLVVEWTAQRYRTDADGTGHAMVSIARRGYGEQARAFLQELKAGRQRDIEALAAFDFPDIVPTR